MVKHTVFVSVPTLEPNKLVMLHLLWQHLRDEYLFLAAMIFYVFMQVLFLFLLVSLCTQSLHVPPVTNESFSFG